MKNHLTKTSLRILVLASAVVLGGAGCATLETLPPELAQVRFELADSPVVRVSKAWVERDAGRLVLRGHVLRQSGASDTTPTHLDISLLDAGGHTVREMREYFEPRQIPRRRRMPDAAHFRIELEPLPPGVASIRVAAHEGAHP